MFLLPPGVLLLLLVVGLVKKKRKLTIAATALLYLLSLPPVSQLLIGSLEVGPDPIEGAQAIVVLGGGVVNAVEYGAPDVSEGSLSRVRYGVYLQKQTGLPLLFTGGWGEAAAMANAARDFQAPGEIWLEEASQDTHQNAKLSAAILRQHQVKTILLVSHASHLGRARRAFARLGFDVRVRPTRYAQPDPWSGGIFAVLPAYEALFVSSQALEEWLGVVYYRLRRD